MYLSLFFWHLLTISTGNNGLFEKYKQRWNKRYHSNVEEAEAKKNFLESLQIVGEFERLKAENRLGAAQPSYSLDAFSSPFADLSFQAFRSAVLMESRAPQEDCSATHRPEKGSVGMAEVLSVAAEARGIEVQSLPSSFDWRDFAVVSEVKNQGKCGSCWTFSATGAVEAHQAIAFGAWRAPRVSEQQLIDCAQGFDTHGCNGGLPSHAFEYIRYAGGITEEFAYAYEGIDRRCRYVPGRNTTIIGAHVLGGSVNVTVGDEEAIKYFIATRGPVSIAFEVLDEFRLYKKGVYSSAKCKNGPHDVNHAVLAIGYGSEDGVPYWLVKNSWGYDWGDSGYFKIARGNNMCGVAECASFPDIRGHRSFRPDFSVRANTPELKIIA